MVVSLLVVHGSNAVQSLRYGRVHGSVELPDRGQLLRVHHQRICVVACNMYLCVCFV